MKAHKIVVKAFRAIDEPASCLEFLRGHHRVLKRFNIAHITSNTTKWAKDQSTIAFTIESLTDGSMLAGGRLQVFDYKTPLPIENAVADKDRKIYSGCPMSGRKTVLQNFVGFGIPEMRLNWE